MEYGARVRVVVQARPEEDQQVQEERRAFKLKHHMLDIGFLFISKEDSSVTYSIYYTFPNIQIQTKTQKRRNK